MCDIEGLGEMNIFGLIVCVVVVFDDGFGGCCFCGRGYWRVGIDFDVFNVFVNNFSIIF